MIEDRAIRLEHTDKPIRMKGASWIEPSGAAVLFDDFLGDLLADEWAVDSAKTGTNFAISATAGGADTPGHGGWAVGVTDADADNANEALVAELNWYAEKAGNGMLVMEARIILPLITAVAAYVGFTDALDDGDLPQEIGSSQDITSNAEDAAGWGFDTDATTDVFYGVAVDSAATGDTADVVGSAPVADTPMVLRVELDAVGTAYFYQDGLYKGSDDAGLTPSVALTPYAGVENRSSSAAKSLEVDYILVACAR
jgi:hypothetical protein